ncbi:GMP synthase, small subunit [Methanocaldococcus vulcanius M7]|uniref:GMP synthase [glutamine-hydrolyzing] subunit A n=1 Tax=Methanocaldococcus vulcanius (strain ATCC 700851 / DSM 12094 / M7) TaxID=579137 RepID=C9REW9_METVM|nr:GMP synthase subunit A [Methanocaldococcus vulcanius]ACX72121.1 GMP synthase, small subunit [Methanocaldococcus vulcanius M7]
MIVILDNGGQYVHRIHRSLKYLGVPSKIIPNTTPLTEIESNEDIKGIILSGGPNIEKAKQCIDIALNAKLPILGICLGHQIIALAYGGEIGRAEAEEYALTEIYVDEEDDLFKNVPKKFKAWASHKDEVKKIPKNFKILAHSDICKVEAMKHMSKSIYGVQFHPEVAHTEYGSEILKNFCKVCGYEF